MAEPTSDNKRPIFLPPGRLQTGDVHVDVTQIVKDAPLYAARPTASGKACKGAKCEPNE